MISGINHKMKGEDKVEMIKAQRISDKEDIVRKIT